MGGEAGQKAEGTLLRRGHVFPVWDVAAAPLGHYFASASGDRTARVWVTERAHSLRMLAGHHSDVSTVTWHPNGDLLASGSDDRTIRLWDVREGRPRRILVGHGCAVRFWFWMILLDCVTVTPCTATQMATCWPPPWMTGAPGCWCPEGAPA